MIAYRLWRDGKHKAKVRPGREWLPVKTGVLDDEGKEIPVPIGEVAKFLDDYFWSAVELYNETELFGCLPFSGGWAEQPYEIYRVLRVMKSEANRWERLESEKKHGKGNART